MDLKHRVETSYIVDYYDFQEFVKEHLGIDNYEFVQDEECSNDSSHRFSVKEELNGYDKKAAQSILEGEKQRWGFNARAILNALYLKGAIKPGNYTITACW